MLFVFNVRINLNASCARAVRFMCSLKIFMAELTGTAIHIIMRSRETNMDASYILGCAQHYIGASNDVWMGAAHFCP